MEFERIKYKSKKFFDYVIDYVHNVFFKLLLLFLLNLIIFGLYFKDFFKNNFFIFIILFLADLFLIRKLLYRRARFAKVFVIVIVLLLSFFVANLYSAFLFESFGLNSLLAQTGSLSDKMVLSSTKDMLKTTSEGGKNFLNDVSGSVTHSKEDSQKTFEYINEIRQEYGVKQLVWDDKIYELAKWKAEDMTKKGYFDHVDPDRKCVGSYAKNFGLRYSSDSYADNLFGYSSSTFFDSKEAVDSWMGSRGHKYNLLYSGHVRGAIACDSKNCVFIGQGGSNWVCDTGEAGLAFWNAVGKQPGEK